jgi:hypothetical protein
MVHEKQFAICVFLLIESIIVCSSAAFDARRMGLTVRRAYYSLLNVGERIADLWLDDLLLQARR